MEKVCLTRDYSKVHKLDRQNLSPMQVILPLGAKIDITFASAATLLKLIITTTNKLLSVLKFSST